MGSGVSDAVLEGASDAALDDGDGLLFVVSYVADSLSVVDVRTSATSPVIRDRTSYILSKRPQ
jgi:hypothetical protein